MKDINWSALKVPKGRVNNNLDDYLARVYKENKEVLESAARRANNQPGRIAGQVTPMGILQQDLMGLYRKNPGITIGQAVKILGRSGFFVSHEERRLMNAQAAIRSNPQVYNAVRRAWGWNQKIDWNQLRPTEDPNVYMLGDIVISFTNSPYSIEVSKDGDTQSFERF